MNVTEGLKSIINTKM